MVAKKYEEKEVFMIPNIIEELRRRGVWYVLCMFYFVLRGASVEIYESSMST